MISLVSKDLRSKNKFFNTSYCKMEITVVSIADWALLRTKSDGCQTLNSTLACCLRAGDTGGILPLQASLPTFVSEEGRYTIKPQKSTGGRATAANGPVVFSPGVCRGSKSKRC